MRTALLVFLLLAAPFAAIAGEADIVAVAVERHPGTEDMFDVRATILSNDRDNDYRADAFEVLTPDGRLLGRRELPQTPATQQPFTSVMENLRIPVGIDRVKVRAHHTPRGYDGQTVTIQLPR